MQTPPIPRIPGQGWIVLIGGGEFSFGETREIDEFLVARLPDGNRRIAFLPTASGSNEYGLHLGKYFKTIAADIEVVNVPIYRVRDARRARNVALIRQAGLIYLGGGVTNNLIEAVRQSPTQDAIFEASQRGVTITAIGAAASALGRMARDMRRAGGFLAGFNWIVDAAIEPNFEAESDVELRRLMYLPEVKIGLGIPRGTAIAIGPDGVGEILGGGRAAVVRKPSASMQ